MREFYFIVTIIYLLSTNVVAQMNRWKKVTIDKGSITVTYRFSRWIDDNGKKKLRIEDTTKTIDTIAFNKFVALMKDVERHRQFTGDHNSELVRKESDSISIVYYYSDNPWPIENSDCVARMVATVDTARKYACFSFTSTPNLKEDRGVKRMKVYHVTYSLKDVGNGRSELMITGKTSPAVFVPLWVIKSAFPGAPVNTLRKIVELTKP